MTTRNAAATMALTLLTPTLALADPKGLRPEDRGLLAAYARDTWRSVEAMSSATGLPADGLRRQGDGWAADGLTSPSNVAAYLWSVLAAEDLRLITPEESHRRLVQTLEALTRLERAQGFFYNWYDPTTGEKSRAWPGGGVVRPFLSSVDNGWLAAALMVVQNARPGLRSTVEPLLGPMNFAFFYNPYDASDPVARPGLLRGGYWPDDKTFTAFHYGMLNTEPRIASYVGIARGQLPPEHYYRMLRANPAVAATEAEAPTRRYDGVAVAEGAQEYRGMKLVPTWDGTMFEALMVTLLVPEAEWAPQSWGINHSLYVKGQIEHGLSDPRLGFWGVSASCDPQGGYHAFGVPGLGAWSKFNTPAERRDGVITPHASLLALRYAPTETMANLRAMAERFPVYSSHGFADSVDVITGRVSDRILVLDQGMILAAIVNALNDDALVRAFSDGAVEAAVRPLIAQEQFESRHAPTAAAEVENTIKTSAARTAAGTDVVTTDWVLEPAAESPIPAPHLNLDAKPNGVDDFAPLAAALGEVGLQAVVEPDSKTGPKRRGRNRRRNRGGADSGAEGSSSLC